MRRRFFVEAFQGASATLCGEAAHHLGRVLRAEPGQLCELSDCQAVWLARIERVGREAIEFALIEPIEAHEPAFHVVLMLSIIKFDRFEWCLEKASELGVAQVCPLAAARSDKALIAAAGKRARRWERVLVESAQQARRLRPAVLGTVVSPQETFAATRAVERESTSKQEVRILLSERPDAQPLRTLLTPDAKSAVLAIGPEGGWTDEELRMARSHGFVEASLGANILRTETAVIAALAVLNYALGD